MTAGKIKDSYSDDVRLALLEQSINNINNTLTRFEKRFDQSDAKFERLESEQKSQFRWLCGLILGLYVIIGSTGLPAIIKFLHS